MELSNLKIKIQETVMSLISLDSDDNYNEYFNEERVLQSYIMQYLLILDNPITIPEKKYTFYSIEIINSISKAIKNYNSSKGNFLTLFFTILNNEIKATKIKEQRQRGGLVIPEKKQKDINKIIAYANKNCLNPEYYEDLKIIANALDFKLDYAYALTKLNYNVLAITEADTITTEENSTISIFDTIKTYKRVEDNIFEQEGVIEILNIIEKVFNNKRSDSLKTIKTLITFDILGKCDVNKNILSRYSFINKDILRRHVPGMKMPSFKAISALLGKSTESTSRTYNNFRKEVIEELNNINKFFL